MSDVKCEICFHFGACYDMLDCYQQQPLKVMAKITECSCFVDASCVKVEMTEAQIKEATERLNQKAQEFVDLKTKLENGDRSFELYKKIMAL